MKKILIIVMALVLLLPVTSAFAYTGGFLDGKALNRGASQNIKTTEHYQGTDSSITTYITVSNSGGTYDTVWYEFDQPTNLTHYQLNSNGGSLKINYYLESGTSVREVTNPVTDGTKTSLQVDNVKKVSVTNTNTISSQINEFDVFGTVETDYGENVLSGKTLTILKDQDKVVQGTTTRITDGDSLTSYTLGSYSSLNNTAEYIFTSPTKITGIKVIAQANAGFAVRAYDTLGNLILNGNSNNYTSTKSLNIEGVKRFIVHNSNNTNSYALNEVELYSIQEPLTYSPVSELTETHTYNSADLSWTNPTATGFTGTIIKKDGIEVANLTNTKSSHSITSLDSETNYTFEVISTYSDGGKAIGETISVRTAAAPPPEQAGEIIDLTVEAEPERVDLSWSLPDSDVFKHVNIYRDTISETSLLNKMLGMRIAYAAENKIFETNGTYFNDLTVDPETTYEYTLTTTSTEGAESEGVTTEVTTPELEIVGGGYEKDPTTGDFTYYWDEPTSGQVKVMLGGVLYKTVDAAEKQLSIPSKDMKYKTFGDPDVSLVPVSSSGIEGEPAKPGLNGVSSGDFLENVEMPFSLTDLFKTSNGLMLLVGGFILLSLAFMFVPKLLRMIRQSFSKNKGNEGLGANDRRFQSDQSERVPRERVERQTIPKEDRTIPKIPRERKTPRVSAREKRVSNRTPRTGRG